LSPIDEDARLARQAIAWDFGGDQAFIDGEEPEEFYDGRHRD
jgi:hypothetical protein